jgi:DNA polymerase III subunit delta
MAGKTFEGIVRDIRNKVFHPVYFLMGDETFYIDVIADLLEQHVLSETEREFNLSILYGKDTDINGILTLVKQYPMSADHHLVIIREAQHIRDMENLLSYVQKPLSSTILVICYKYKTYDRRKKFIKEVEKTGVVFEGKKLYDNQVPGWINDYVNRKGYRIGPQAVQLLADHLGADIGKIVNEIGKVFINLKKGEEITPLLIEENIGISKDYNNFEFQHALGERDAGKAFMIATYFADNPKANPLVLTLGVLYQYFSKLLIYQSLKDKSRRSVASALSVNDFFVSQYQRAAANYTTEKLIRIIGYLRESDNKSKGIGNVSVSDGELLRELTYKILN